jgi:iron complex transport system ATP-binding protein
MMELKRYSASLGTRQVLHDISFSAAPGAFVAICGPNGAGKTTLLRALAGLLTGTQKPDPKRVAYVEQGARSSWALSVAEVVSLGRIPHGDTRQDAITGAMARCGVAHLAAHRIDRVSGGQARRAMLARAFATEPETLLLDEPVADLDPFAAHDILRHLADFAAAGGLVIAVLHAVDLAVTYATRMLVLDNGRIVADDAPLAALPAAARSFGLELGEDRSPRFLPPPRQKDF